jgi:hypothetical protein
VSVVGSILNCDSQRVDKLPSTAAPALFDPRVELAEADTTGIFTKKVSSTGTESTIWMRTGVPANTETGAKVTTLSNNKLTKDLFIIIIYSLYCV